jgi:chromosome segregation ATPase
MPFQEMVLIVGSPEPGLNQDRERAARIDELERDLAQATNEVERLTLERDFYSKRTSTLEEENRQLTETATKYSLWGQKLERELARIDPDGAPARRFDAQDE